jgi:hypothetical protein
MDNNQNQSLNWWKLGYSLLMILSIYKNLDFNSRLDKLKSENFNLSLQNSGLKKQIQSENWTFIKNYGLKSQLKQCQSQKPLNP